jgi:hypothetical protein
MISIELYYVVENMDGRSCALDNDLPKGCSSLNLERIVNYEGVTMCVLGGVNGKR